MPTSDGKQGSRMSPAWGRGGEPCSEWPARTVFSELPSLWSGGHMSSELPA